MPSEAKRALIIDDAPADRTLVSGILKGFGYTSAEAVDGQEGLDIFAKNGPFSLIILDWYMPKMDGIAFLKALRSVAPHAKTKVIMISAETELGKIRNALTAGANEYLMKPYNRESLQLKLRMLGIE